MKIRWTQTSIRLRITPTELHMLALGEQIEENLGRIPGAWSVVIAVDPTITDLAIDGGLVRLRLSATDRDRLMAPDCEGVYFQTDDSHELRYFIEKDFPCAHPRAAEALEPETETFRAPIDFVFRKT